MDFRIDPKAPTLPEDEKLLPAWDVQQIIQGARLVCESIQDNDIERFHFTLAGQFIRETGEKGGRFYVLPADIALRDHLDGWAEDAVVADLRKALSDAGRHVPTAAPAV